MHSRRHVALLIETSNAYSRGLLEGIIAYVRQHESWSIYLPEQQRGAKPPAGFERWRGDGIIARIETEEIARTVLRTRLPVVDVSAARRVESIPWVETNDQMIARLAAEHLLNRGFKQLAYCGDARFNWSRWRASHFARYVQEAGCVCTPHEEIVRVQLERGKRLLVETDLTLVGVTAVSGRGESLPSNLETRLQWFTPRSHHPAGMNASRCDGSVSFFSEDIDEFVWRAMTSAAGEEVFNQ